MVEQQLEVFLARATDALRRHASSRRWLLHTTLFAVLTSLVLSTPGKELFVGEPVGMQAVMRQVEEPLVQHDYEATSHEDKLAFRLTVPVVAHVLGIRHHLGVTLLVALAGVALILVAAGLADDLLRDRVSATLVALAVATTIPGNLSFVEPRGIFDGVALLFLLVGMRTRSPLVVYAMVVLASFTDERGAVAAAFLPVFYACTGDGSMASVARSLVSRRSIAVALGWATYLDGRSWLGHAYGLHTSSGAVGLHRIVDDMNNFAIGVWTGIEGLWIPVLLAIFVLATRSRALLVAAVGVMSAVLVAAFAVYDISRSVGYELPAVFCALAILRRTESRDYLRRILAVTAVLCVLWPSYHVGGKDAIWWHSPPLPVQLLRWMTH